MLEFLLNQGLPLRTPQGIHDLKSSYEKLSRNCKDLLERINDSVEKHQLYKVSYENVIDCLSSIQNLFVLNKDSVGDQLDLQDKLEKLKVIHRFYKFELKIFVISHIEY